LRIARRRIGRLTLFHPLQHVVSTDEPADITAQCTVRRVAIFTRIDDVVAARPAAAAGTTAAPRWRRRAIAQGRRPSDAVVIPRVAATEVVFRTNGITTGWIITSGRGVSDKAIPRRAAAFVHHQASLGIHGNAGGSVRAFVNVIGHAVIIGIELAHRATVGAHRRTGGRLRALIEMVGHAVIVRIQFVRCATLRVDRRPRGSVAAQIGIVGDAVAVRIALVIGAAVVVHRKTGRRVRALIVGIDHAVAVGIIRRKLHESSGDGHVLLGAHGEGVFGCVHRAGPRRKAPAFLGDRG
jgi:hypothetical protein